MINEFETYLEHVLTAYGTSTTQKAMAYSYLGGGKRIRPRLLFSLLEDLGGAIKDGYNAAAAIEMIHTYSLIHDDLPSMDNDDFRRHKPTNHKVFGEGQAILAGDALLTAAFEVLAQSDLNPLVIVQCIQSLTNNAGANGMILGQEIDTIDFIPDIDILNTCYELKTGCLFAAALEMATIISGYNEHQLRARKIGLKLGVAFQYQDDILEATTAFESLGKSNTSDINREKATVVTMLGLEEAKQSTDILFEEIKSLINELNLNGNNLIQTIEEMTDRKF